MIQYFKGSIFVTIAGLITAFLWAESHHAGAGFAALFIVCILAILEVSLSFDNAVVNAMKLEKMEEIWHKRFLTWGIAIAVFGMRFLFPLMVVSIFAHKKILNVLDMALNNSQQYAFYLQETHASISAFGGLFLLMLFLHYFFDSKKTVHWIKPLENWLSHLDDIRGIEIIIAIVILVSLQGYLPHEVYDGVLKSGLMGIITFLAIDGLSKYLEKRENMSLANCAAKAGCTGFVGFMYLELIDASFSLDGVLGAFALSSDIVIISIGLAIGAMFVRSLTILLVEKKTLAQFLYLEHGAHWAIGALAVIMLISTKIEVPETVTGLIGLFFIVLSLISSILHNKLNKEN